MAHKRSITEEQFKLAKQLTALQRKFVLNIVSKGMSQRQAYIKAGGRAKTKDSQDNSASQIFSKLQVKAFHDHLMSAAIEKSTASRTEALNELADIMREKKEKTNHRVAAIRQMSKMEGWDAPAEVKHSGGLEVTNIINEIVN